MNERISIIIPVYNVEKYLTRCIDSILAQTFSDFELILVNDGSPDRCGEICDEYAQRDRRIKVIHQKNGGVSKARNAGLNVCTGDYVMFCDSDDSLPQNALWTLLSAMVSMDTDMVIGDFEKICINKFDNTIQFQKSLEREAITVNMNDRDKLYSFWCANNMLSSCGRLFKSDYIKSNNLLFNEKLIVMEDYAFVLDYLSCCERISMIPDIVYNYYSYTDSPMLVRRSRKDFFDDVVYVSNKLESFLKSLSNKDSQLYLEKTIYPTLRFAYGLLWETPAPTLKLKIRKYNRIKEALSEPRFQNALVCCKEAYGVWVYFCMKMKFPWAIPIIYRLRRFI